MHIPLDLPPLVADPVRFKQILFNLLSNAVKFTPDSGTITVAARHIPAGTGETEKRRNGEAKKSVATEPPAPIPRFSDSPTPTETDFLEISVQDTGSGIRPDDFPKLFTEFTQLATTAAQAHEGTGLGLALTKRLVELHGGTITAASPGEGQGATFTVRLPLGGPRGRAEE
jgi:signal transduction histidine kinase